MENQHKLALFVTYYLARFDTHAIFNLGYKNWDQAFAGISTKLGVKKHSVRNWRDEFDPLFGYRSGWHQRPMAPSRTNVALALENLDEPEILAIVDEILSGNIYNYPENLTLLLSIPDLVTSQYKVAPFILRGPTGKKAEQFFVDYHRNYNLPAEGNLFDTRDLGCGYDFEIKSDTNRFFIEVKGCANRSGGILLTNKEWEKAKQERERYILCLVSNINESPDIIFINDPFSRLNPKKSIIQAVQVQWTISSNEIQSLNA